MNLSRDFIAFCIFEKVTIVILENFQEFTANEINFEYLNPKLWFLENCFNEKIINFINSKNKIIVSVALKLLFNLFQVNEPKYFYILNIAFLENIQILLKKDSYKIKNRILLIIPFLMKLSYDFLLYFFESNFLEEIAILLQNSNNIETVTYSIDCFRQIVKLNGDKFFLKFLICFPILELIFYKLKALNLMIILSALDFIDVFFEVAEFSENKEVLISRIQSFGGLEILEELLVSPEMQIQIISEKILNNFFERFN